MQLGFIGLGRMGSRMVTKLVEEGHEMVVWNRSPEKAEELKFKIHFSQENLLKASNSKLKGAGEKLKVAKSMEDLLNDLAKPRVVWLMLPAGEPTQEILDRIEDGIKEGDIVVDGGNAHYTDTQRRYEHFKSKGIRFLGIGVSGGIIAAKEGYPLMAGGDKSAYEEIKPLLDSLAKPNGGHEYFGEGGAGHFVKMVHNGIEYGIMQSVGEGFGVLERSPYNLDLVKVAKLYERGTLVSGFMMQRTIESLEKDPKLGAIDGYIEASGEGEWTVEEAKKQNLPIEVIGTALNFRTKSRQDKKIAFSFAARMVAALRHAFGGHKVKKS